MPSSLPGQIVGDTLHRGKWNDGDAIPLMIRSALAIGMLPTLSEQCAWLPVDTVARSVVEIAGLGEKEEEALQTTDDDDNNDEDDTSSPLPNPYIFNIVNPHTFAWTETFLPALRAAAAAAATTASFHFDIVPPKTWLRRLRDYNDSEQDIEGKKNPSVKLLEFWAEKIESSTTTMRARGNQSGEEGEAGGGFHTFDTTMARGKSAALRGAPDIIADGYVEVMLRGWLGMWRGECEG